MARARGAPRPALLGIGGAIAIAIAIAIACACAAGVPVPELQHVSGAALVFADAPAGRVRGRVVETLSSRGLFAEAYRGIPFAAAPTGARRFRPPEDLVTLPQVQGGDADAEEAAPFFDAGEVAAACSQPNDPWGGAAPQRRPPPPGRAEDCLYLNVFAPARADRGSDARLPVLVFVHGGGFIAGTGGDALYDGGDLAASRGVVVVTLNYRLGILGLAAPRGSLALDGAAGNYALLDQRSALRWVRRNIDAFGGDAGRVLLFGESAGGYSVGAHLVADGGSGGDAHGALFHAALIESGGFGAGNREDALARADAMAAYLGCNVTAEGAKASDLEALACLQAQDLTSPEVWQDINNAVDAAGAPGSFCDVILDGALITEDPWQSLAAGRAAGVPVLAGTNTDEGTLFMRLPKPTAEADFWAYTSTWLGNTSFAARAVELYVPLVNGSDWYVPAERFTGDFAMTCPMRRALRLLATARGKAFNNARAAGDVPGIWAYHYDLRYKCDPWFSFFGVSHSLELGPVFQHMEPRAHKANCTDFAPDEWPIVEAIGRFWAQMAAMGDPNNAATKSGVQNQKRHSTRGRPWLAEPKAFGIGAQAGASTSSLPAWPRVPSDASAAVPYMTFGFPAVRIEAGWRKAECDLYDEWVDELLGGTPPQVRTAAAREYRAP